jgi:endoplasmic reticulum resident protein 29 (fragment)
MQILLNKCLKEFDVLAIKFMKPDLTKDMRTDLLKEAKKQSEKLVKEEEKKSADVYIKLMEKVIERGTLFIKSEQERVKNLIAGKLNESKKTDMQARLNILESFMETGTLVEKKDEL